MATQDKLLKSLEQLKQLTNANHSSGGGDYLQKKKEKIQHCNLIVEAIQNPTIKVAKNFVNLLSFTIEVLLQLCDDSESDIRMIADECLNKIIRGMNNDNISKIQIELLKAIKQNGSARSLRAALSRFSLLAHFIRPQKGKGYVTNVIPALVKIFARNEESVHETLASSLPDIMRALGPFVMDYDAKDLLKACLNNVQNPSTVLRRTTASCALTICLHSRGPFIFLCYIFHRLFDLLIPPQDSQNYLILGALGCIKSIIPHLNETERSYLAQSKFQGRSPRENLISAEKMIEMYELCLYYALHKDHNVVNCALETLNVLLSNLGADVKATLLGKKGLGRSRVLENGSPLSVNRIRSPSQASVATTLKSEENLLLHSDLTDFVATDIERWIDESKLSVINVKYVNTGEDKPPLVQDRAQEIKSIPSVNYGNVNIGLINDQDADSIRSESIADNMDKLQLYDDTSEKSVSTRVEDKSTIGDAEYASLVLQDIDIGHFTDPEVSLVYCARMIAKQFLLTGTQNGLIPDQNVRVSTKNLALMCISAIVQLHPHALVKYLDRNCGTQRMLDILLYENHQDPLIRGVVRVVICNFLSAVLVQSFGDFKEWLATFPDAENAENSCNMEDLIHLILKGLQDESSTCTRQCLTSLNSCLSKILESKFSRKMIPVLNYLPLMAKDPYWLVKVKLLELITSFQYVTVHHVTRSKEFQNKIVHNVLLELLKDEDQRVRNAASVAIVKIVPLLFFEADMPRESRITCKAIAHRNLFSTPRIENAIETNIKLVQQLQNLPFPFHCYGMQCRALTDRSLSRVLNCLYRKLITQNNKHYTLGCIETLCDLSYAYPATVYKTAWNCFKKFTAEWEKPVFERSNSATSYTTTTEDLTSAKDLLSLSVNLLTNTTLTYDMTCHMHLIKLTGNIFCGKCLETLRPTAEIHQEVNELWHLLADNAMSAIAEEYLTHLVKILNIYMHVIEEHSPVLPQAKPTLSNLPSASALSPIKRRKSDLGDKRILSPGKIVEKDNDKDKKSEQKANALGYFSSSAHYLKMYEILKGAYNNYKVTLSLEASENFLKFLRAVLHSMCQILEVTTLRETGRIAEELLLYLRSTFTLEPTSTVQCVQQLLKSLFDTNISSDPDTFLKYLRKTPSKAETDDGITNSGFFYHIAHVPVSNMSDCIRKLNQISKNEIAGDSIVMGYVHRKENKKIINKNLDKILANYIPIFEPMVIKSLKHYTMTSDVKLQAQVLQLLSQLVLLKVNYCLLDSEQIFIDFVLKQFQFMEAGQISFANELIPKIFQFLVHLSYEKQHTKSIIIIPKIIQLCDGLMASGQSPRTHCIPALKPIVEDVFLLRNKSNTADFKELETTREVLVSSMLKLIEFAEILHLLVMILNDSKYCENTERWLRWSKQIFDSFLAQLRFDKILLEEPECADAARRLLYALHPNVFKPLSYIFIALFEEAIDIVTVLPERFLAKLNLLLLITSQLNESKFLLTIEEIQAEIPPHAIFEKFSIVHDPLNVSKTSAIFDGIMPEVIFLKFLFRTINIAARFCVDEEVSERSSSKLSRQFHQFLTFCLYIFQSGTHKKTTQTGIRLINGELADAVEGVLVNETNKSFLQLRATLPILTFQWCYILMLLNYNERSFWANIVQITDNYGIDLQLASTNCEPEISCINKEIVRVGGSIVFADYLCEQILTDGEQMSWFLVNNIQLIVEHHEEPPIFELLGAIHRNSSASALLIQAIAFKCLASSSISTKSNILSCLENVHESQTGNLLLFLLPNMLSTKMLAISRQTANLASRKIELLLTLTAEAVNKQLPKDELVNILELLVGLKLVKKHETLIGLLNKLATQFYDLSPLEFDQRRSIHPEYIKTLQIDNAWYNSQVKQGCLASTASAGYAEILSKLSYNELMAIMNHKDFNKKIFRECFIWCRNHCDRDSQAPDLLKACSTVIIKMVNSLRSVMPKAHHVYKPVGREASHVEQKYSSRLTEILTEAAFYDLLTQVIPCVSEYIACVSHFSELSPASTHREDFARFAVICLEIVAFSLDSSEEAFDVHLVTACLRCSELIVKETSLCEVLSSSSHVPWLCSAINSLYKFVNFLLNDCEPLPSMPLANLRDTLENPDAQPAGHAVHQLHVLVCWLERIDVPRVQIPSYFMQSIISIVISLARLPLVNSYILTPPTAWKSGWCVALSGPFLTRVPPLPLEYMQEVDILEEFIFRITLLGWTCRPQFEETWVYLLSALSVAPTANAHLDDFTTIVNSSSLAVQAITAILLQTLYAPQPGNKCLSSYIHVPRDAELREEGSPTLTKLRSLHSRFAKKLLEYPHCWKAYRQQMNVFDKPNVEKTSSSSYSYSQLSLEYLRLQSSVPEASASQGSRAAKVCARRAAKLQETGIDLRSCLQILLDLFSQCLNGNEPTPLRLLQEIIKSIIQISDTFNDRSQFQWMLDTCVELAKAHPIEDEVIHQYLVIGVCKASAVLGLDRELLEYVKKLISQSLKNTFLPSRIAGLHGLLYILQMCVQDKESTSEKICQFLPIAIDYIEYNISAQNAVLQVSQEHTLLVWALVFYILENVSQLLVEASFVETVITTLLNVLSDSALNISLYLPLIKGIERLIIQRTLPPELAERVIKYASTQFKKTSSILSLPTAQLLFSSLYIEYAQHIDAQSTQIVPSNPDHLAQSTEKISAIFDKIKKGYPFEVDLLSQSLSDLLIDIFSPADILTKVISEFLSPHQRHPMQLCKIVFNIFESAIQQSQLSLLQDWVVFSLNNFTQSFSIGMATWCLTCFFISASDNVFLRNLFPYVQRRMGRYEYEDRKFLCIAGSDFYRNLSTDNQKRIFMATLVSVKDQPDTPFNELLLCL